MLPSYDDACCQSNRPGPEKQDGELEQSSLALQPTSPLGCQRAGPRSPSAKRACWVRHNGGAPTLQAPVAAIRDTDPMVCLPDAPVIRQQALDDAWFNDPQRWSLERMADVIVPSAGATADDLENAPFTEHGGVHGAIRDLGKKGARYLDRLNAELTG